MGISDTSLEQTFSDLAYSHLTDKASGLVDYLVGFQLIKSEEEGKRAVGIFGFEIEEDYYYVPAFFLNGEIRGLDSIYSVKADLFMPLNEDWTNTLIHRRQARLGEVDKRGRQQRGINVPNYARLKIVPGGGGNSLFKISRDNVEQLKTMRTDYDNVTLPEALKMMGPSYVNTFKYAMAKNPQLREIVEGFYNWMDFATEGETVKIAEEKEKPVVIVNSIAQAEAKDLTDDQKARVARGGVGVMDKRPELSKSVLYSTQADQRLENPTSGGLYDVLWADGSVSKTLVATLSGFREVFVYDPENENYCLIDPRKVFVIRQYEDKVFRAWLLENGYEPDKLKGGDTAIFITLEGTASDGFCLDNKLTGFDGNTVYKINDTHFMQARGTNCYGTPHNDYFHSVGPHEYNQYSIVPKGANYGEQRNFWNTGVHHPLTQNVKQVIVTDVGVDKPITYVGNKLVISTKNCRALIINHHSENVSEAPAPADLDAAETYAKKRKNVVLDESDFGDNQTIFWQLKKIAYPLEAWKDSNEIVVRSHDKAKAFNKVGALSHLMIDHGLSEDDANIVISDAGRSKNTYYVKKAVELLQQPDMSQDEQFGTEMDQFHKGQYPLRLKNVAQSPFNREFYQYLSPFGAGGDDDDDNSSALDPDGQDKTMGTLDTAGKTGQKEVFDSAALSSLIKAGNPTELAERFLPTITSGMDRIGRILFLVYWHYDDFEQKYGDKELGEFIDNLRSTFETVGDSIIFIRQKTLTGDGDSFGLGTQSASEDLNT